MFFVNISQNRMILVRMKVYTKLKSLSKIETAHLKRRVLLRLKNVSSKTFN